MIILAGSLRVQPGRMADALPLVRELVARTQEEPGCMAYSYAIDVDDDHLFRIFEVFVDEAALAAHRASAHMAAWRAQREAAGVYGRAMAEYQVGAWREI